MSANWWDEERAELLKTIALLEERLEEAKCVITRQKRLTSEAVSRFDQYRNVTESEKDKLLIKLYAARRIAALASPAVPSTQTSEPVAETCDVRVGGTLLCWTAYGSGLKLPSGTKLYTHPSPASTSPAVSVDEVKQLVQTESERCDQVGNTGGMLACSRILDNLSGSAK